MSDVELHDAQSGFVEFKFIEGAEAALSTASHCLANFGIEVKEAEPWYQPDHIFNALNEDCLRHIFEYFELYDLMNVAEVCTRLNELSKHVFAAKFKRMEVKRSYLCGNRTYYFEKMLRIFGSLIQSLSIESLDYHQSILQMINEHTTQLKELKLISFRIDRIENFNSMLFNLEVLELDGCCVYNLSDLLSVCTELRVLKIIYTNIGCANKLHKNVGNLPMRCLSQRFAKLEEIHSFGALSDHDLRCLVTLDCPLKVLVLVNNRTTRLLTPDIFRHHPNLEKLVLYHHIDRNDDTQEEKPFQLNQSLGSLKTVMLSFRSTLVPSLTKIPELKQAPIEELVLRFSRINSVEVSILTQLKTIRSLKLSCVESFTDEHLMQLAKELPQLQNLVLSSSTADEITGTAVKTAVKHATKLTSLVLGLSDGNQRLSIGIDDYNEMLNAVCSRLDESNLTINISGSRSGKFIFVHDDTLLKNENWIKINTDFKYDGGEEYHYVYNGFCDRDPDKYPDEEEEYEEGYGYHDELGHYQYRYY